MTRLRLAAVAVLVALTATACGMGGGNGGDSASSGGHLVYDTWTTPAAAWALETDDAFILSNAGCLETLVKYGYDGKLEPMLATSWKQVDATDWEFTLRDGVNFQDGAPLNADAVVGALNHLLAVKTPAKAFNSTAISSVTAVDASTVRITTPAEDPLLALRVASPNTGILGAEGLRGRPDRHSGNLHRSFRGDRQRCRTSRSASRRTPTTGAAT